MEEVRIIKSIKYHIVNRYKIGKIWHKKDLCAYIATILYPFFDNIQYESDAECLQRMGGSIVVISKKLNKKLKSLRKKHFDLLKSYSFNGLVEFFKSELDDSILTDDEIKNAISLVDKIDTSDCVSLNGDDKLFDTIMNSYKDCEYLCKYGTFEYVNGDEENDNNQIDNDIEAKIDETSNTLYNENFESTQSDREKKEIESKISKLYEDLVGARGGEDAITQFEYIWQWKISKSEYQEIKKLLLSDACKKNIKEICKTNAHCRFIIVIYIAERYKREWNGSDGEDNALIQVGLDCDDIVGLVEKYFDKNLEKIYYSETENGRRYTERLDSLRLEGGLPINYIVGCQNQNNLRSFSEKLYLDENDAINVLNNKTIKYSYEKQYSIYKYICLIKQDLFSNIFSAEYLEDGLIKNFIELLKEGRKKAQKKSNKFEYKYRVWTFQDEFLLHKSIVFKQDSIFEETKELISRRRIKEQWGIDNLGKNDIFWLEVKGEKYEFHPWDEDFYRSDVGLVEFVLPTETGKNFDISQDSIYYVDRSGLRKKIQSIVENDKKRILFSSNNGYDWNNGKRGKYSAILLLKKIDVESEHCDVDKQLNGNCRWIEFYDKIKVGNEYIYSSNQEVHPTENVLHPIVKSSYVRKVYHCVGDVQNDIYVLDASNLKAENFVRIDKDGNREKCDKVKYKTKEMSSFEDYQIGEIVQGFIRLDVDGIRLNAYVLTKDAKISRQCSEEQGYIVVDGIGATVEIEDCKLKNQGWIDYYTEENSMRDSVNLRVKLSEDEFILFDVVRPLKRKDKIINGHIVPDNQDIPLKLKSQYKLRVINEKGVKYSKDVRCSRPYSNKRIEKHNKGFYFIDKGTRIEDFKIEKNLEFVFISSEGKETQLSLSKKELIERGNNYDYIYFDNLPNEKGIIIQSLQNVMPELTYYEPKYVDSKDAIANISPLERFKLSIKHKLYFVEMMFLTEKRDETIIDGQGKDNDKYKSIKDEINWPLLTGYLSYYYDTTCKENYNWNDLWEISSNLKVPWNNIPEYHKKNFINNDKNREEFLEALFSNKVE